MEKEFSEMSGVKIICICPGATESSMIRKLSEKSTRFSELEKLATVHLTKHEIQSPEVVADAMLVALEDKSHGVWMVNNGTFKKINMISY
jgi:hypothetical protein